MSNLIPRAAALPQPVPMEAAYKMCQVLAKSDLVPRSYRGKPENIFLAHIAGTPFGWDVTMSMRSFHIIEGQPTLKPEIQVALVRQAGHSVTVKQSNADAVILVGRRSDTGDTAEVSYTTEDAKRAGLLGKGNWKSYPEDMLFARAVSRLNRRLFQDVLLGCAYVPEELGATVDPDGEVISVTSMSELASEIPVSGNSQQVKDVDIIEDVEKSAPVSLLDESLVDDITDVQVKRIHAMKREAGLDDEKYRAGLRAVAGVESSKDLTKSQADEVIAALQRAVDRKRAETPEYWNADTAEEVNQ